MRFTSLRAFRYVMETGTIAAAAERLHLSQPAVSRLVSGLETEIGVAFFVRSGRRLTPTSEGLRLFEETQGLLAAIDHLPAIARELKQMGQKRIRMVSMPRLAASVALPVIASLQKRDPDVQCDLAVLDRVELEKWMTKPEFDLGLVVLPIDNPAVHIKRLGSSSVRVVAPAGHALAGQRAVDFARIMEEPIIALPDGTRDRRDMDALFRSHSAKPKLRSIVPTVEAAASLVAAGVGVSFADELSISAFGHLPVRAIPMSPTWHLAFGLIRPAHRRLTAAVSEVMLGIDSWLAQIRASSPDPFARV